MAVPNRNCELKSHLFTEFPFVWLSNLKFVEPKISNSSFKVLILPPIDSATSGSSNSYHTYPA